MSPAESPEPASKAKTSHLRVPERGRPPGPPRIDQRAAFGPREF